MSDESVTLQETETQDINPMVPNLNQGENNQYFMHNQNQPFNPMQYYEMSQQNYATNFQFNPNAYDPRYMYMSQNFNGFPQFNTSNEMMNFMGNQFNQQNLMYQSQQVESPQILKETLSRPSSGDLNSSVSTKGTPDENYRKRRAKNNEAAKKCRDKKKAEIDRYKFDKERLEENCRNLDAFLVNEENLFKNAIMERENKIYQLAIRKTQLQNRIAELQGNYSNI